jgi:hypothetical protein
MRRGKGILETGIFLLVFALFFGAYFTLTKKEQQNIQIPSGDVFIDDGDISGVISKSEVDFEDPINRKDPSSFLSGKAHTGNFSNILSKEREYSFGIEKRWSEIKLYGAVNQVRFTFWCFSETKLKDVVAVFSTDSIPGKSIDWQSDNIELREYGKWTKVVVTFQVNPVALRAAYLTKIYIWNRAKESFLVDDFSVEFLKVDNHGQAMPGLSLARTIIFDFEDRGESEGIIKSTAHSGRYAFNLSGKDKYSPAVEKHIYEVSPDNPSLITLGAWVYPEDDVFEAVLVVTITKPDGAEYFWEGRSTDKGTFPKGKWTKHRGQFKLPFDKISKEDVIKAYVWNKNGSKIYIDDLEVVFGEQQSRLGASTQIDMEKVPASGYVFQRNRAPFKGINLTPVSLTSGLEIVTEPVDLSVFNINAGDLIASGKLVKNSDLTQIAVVRASELQVYGYCLSAHKFQEIYRAELPFIAADEKVVALDIDGDRTDELFIAGKNHKGYFIKVNSLINQCAANVQKLKIQPDFEIELPGNQKDSVQHNFESISIDHNSDLKMELIIQNKSSGHSNLYFLKDNLVQSIELHTEFANSNSSAEFLFWDGSHNNSSGKLYCLETVNGMKQVQSYVWDTQKSNFIEAVDERFLPVDLIEPGCQIFKSGFPVADGSTYVIYNSFWRFDLKTIILDDSGYYASSRADFKGTPVQINPKFHEVSELYTGSFTGKKRPEFIVFSFDCADSNYNGVFCGKLEGRCSVTMFSSEQ